MGADFLLYCCEDPSNYEKAKPLIENRISKIEDDVLNSIADELFWYESEELKEEVEDELKEEDLWRLDDLAGLKIRELIRLKLKDAADDLLDVHNYKRDIAYMTLNGSSYIFSGGMSWGDLPTESCDIINLINMSGLFDGMGRPDFDYDNDYVQLDGKTSWRKE